MRENKETKKLENEKIKSIVVLLAAAGNVQLAQ